MRSTSPNEPPPVYSSQPFDVDALNDGYGDVTALQLESPPAYTRTEVSTDVDQVLSPNTADDSDASDNEAVAVSASPENTEGSVFEPAVAARALVETLLNVAIGREVHTGSTSARSRASENHAGVDATTGARTAAAAADTSEATTDVTRTDNADAQASTS